jgi:hypothetical protein
LDSATRIISSRNFEGGSERCRTSISAGFAVERKTARSKVLPVTQKVQLISLRYLEGETDGRELFRSRGVSESTPKPCKTGAKRVPAWSEVVRGRAYAPVATR